MASYLGLHGSDSMPHQFPPTMAQTQVWKHGLLSGLPSMSSSQAEYTTGIDDLEISQFSEMPDEQDTDIIPSALPPSSFHQWRSAQTPELCAPDPDLGLTPDKGAASGRHNFRTDAKGKTGRKVRFDVESSSESELEKSPNMPYVPSSQSVGNSAESRCLADMFLNESNAAEGESAHELPKVYTYSVKSMPHSTLKDPQLTDIETVLVQERKRKTVKLKENPPKSTKGENSSISGDSGDVLSVTREQEERPVVSEYSFPFRQDSEEENGILLSSAFERPEYNTTLKLGNELNDLISKKTNVAKAVKKTLKTSETLRTGINEKAASRVNPQGDVYQGLATLHVPIDDIISQAERDQRSKVKQPCGKNTKPKEPVLKEPDLMEFFTPDLQKEQVDLSVTGVSFPKDTLSLAPHDKAFDLYHHNLAWEQFES